MVPPVNPVIEEEKFPVPVPLEVLLFAVVGLVDVFQQTPLSVILAPPSLMVVAPLVAPVHVIEEAAFVVVIVGAVEEVQVKLEVVICTVFELVFT